MSVAKLKKLIPPPEKPLEVGTPAKWSKIEKQLGITLPEDYRDFIFTYGSASLLVSIGSTIPSPAPHAWRSLIVQKSGGRFCELFAITREKTTSRTRFFLSHTDYYIGQVMITETATSGTPKACRLAGPLSNGMFAAQVSKNTNAPCRSSSTES